MYRNYEIPNSFETKCGMQYSPEINVMTRNRKINMVFVTAIHSQDANLKIPGRSRNETHLQTKKHIFHLKSTESFH